MYSHDKSDFKQYLLNFHTQMDLADEVVEKADLKIDAAKINNIVFLGMGASAIAGDLLNDILFSELKVPMKTVRSYKAPSFCSENTLVIASSYSGDTEETMNAALDASTHNAQFLTITSGGKIKEISEEKGWSSLVLPTGFPPRQALGMTFFALYHTFGKLGLFSGYSSDLSKLKRFIHAEIDKHDHTKHLGHILAQELAKTIQHKIPVIYSSGPFLQTVSKRWKNQLQENSKSIAFANVLPEMNYNEIVGWEMETELKESIYAIFLENEKPNPRIQERIELSKLIIKESGANVIDVYSSGETIIEKVFSLIILGDWVSYYLAMYNKKDPIKIKNIDYLKSKLAKTA